MGDEGDVDRNAANWARFERLPEAGSPPYWAALEDAAHDTRLNLEVLAMCARERLAAGRREHLERIYKLILRKTDATLRAWVNRLIPTSAHDRAGVIEDIMQECALGLWQELDSRDETFLTRGFWIRMWRMTANIAKQKRIEEGLSARTGVEWPTRVPQSERASLDQPAGPGDDRTLGEIVPDPQEEDEYSLIELVNDVRDMARRLAPDERLLLQNELTGELTQAQIGERLGITDRAVRLRLKALRARFRALFNPSGDSGATAGGEEGRS